MSETPTDIGSGYCIKISSVCSPQFNYIAEPATRTRSLYFCHDVLSSLKLKAWQQRDSTECPETGQISGSGLSSVYHNNTNITELTWISSSKTLTRIPASVSTLWTLQLMLWQPRSRISSSSDCLPSYHRLAEHMRSSKSSF